LELIKQLEAVSGDAQAKCRALWTLITTGNEEAVVALVAQEPVIDPETSPSTPQMSLLG
jgi:hypothetical protein